MLLLGRLFVITFAIFVAMLAAGIAIAVALLGPQWHGFSGEIGERVGFWLLVFFGTSFTGAVGFRVDRGAGIDEVGRVSHDGAAIRRTLVVGDRVFSVADGGVAVGSLGTLAEQSWIPFTR